MGDYVKPKIVDSNELEKSGGTKPTGIPVAVFVLAVGVTVYIGAFVAEVGVGWSYAVGTQKVVSS